MAFDGFHDKDGVGSPSTIATDREDVAREGLYALVKLAWHLVDKGKFLDNWHIEEICNHLEACSRGEIKNLIINVPPGCMKSLIVNVFWPAWEWIKYPDKRWLHGSFDASLTRRDSLKLKGLIESKWWQARWGNSVQVLRDHSKANSATEWYTTADGLNFATSVRGKGTGWHVHRRIADDPHKVKDTKGGSEATGVAIKEVIDWWGGAMSNRIADDPDRFVSVVVMQRLHEEDLTGHLLKSGEYVHLCFPMEYDPERPCVTAWGGDRRTVKDELLWPARFSAAKVEELKSPIIGLGAVDYAAQCQQLPMPKSGGIFKRAYFNKRYTEIPEDCQWLQSWDMRFKEDTTSGDMVVGGVWAYKGANLYLVKVVRGRWSFTETLEALKSLSVAFPKATLKIVEDKANGPAVVSMLKNEIQGLTLVNPEGGKVSRANAVQPLFEAGNVWLPADSLGEGWVIEYIDEMCGFPRARFDDQVDMTSQALLRLKSSVFFTFMQAMKAHGAK